MILSKKLRAKILLRYKIWDAHFFIFKLNVRMRVVDLWRNIKKCLRF